MQVALYKIDVFNDAFLGCTLLLLDFSSRCDLENIVLSTETYILNIDMLHIFCSTYSVDISIRKRNYKYIPVMRRRCRPLLVVILRPSAVVQRPPAVATLLLVVFR